MCSTLNLNLPNRDQHHRRRFPKIKIGQNSGLRPFIETQGWHQPPSSPARRHHPKHKTGRNSGLRPLRKPQRWHQPPTPPAILPKKPLQSRKSQLSTPSKKDYTKATMTHTHKSSKNKAQLWKSCPGSHQIQRNHTSNHTDKTVMTTSKDKNCPQIHLCSKHKRVWFYKSNHLSHTQKSFTSSSHHKLCYLPLPLLPPNSQSHSRHNTSGIGSSSPEIYTPS